MGKSYDPNNFAKLFNTPHGQLLVYLDGNEDEEPIIVVQGAAVRGVTPKANLGYDSETDQLCNFDKFDQAGADEIAARLHATADQLAPQ